MVGTGHDGRPLKVSFSINFFVGDLTYLVDNRTALAGLFEKFTDDIELGFVVEWPHGYLGVQSVSNHVLICDVGVSLQ